jgi:hypothetical protein
LTLRHTVSKGESDIFLLVSRGVRDPSATLLVILALHRTPIDRRPAAANILFFLAIESIAYKNSAIECRARGDNVESEGLMQSGSLHSVDANRPHYHHHRRFRGFS